MGAKFFKLQYALFLLLCAMNLSAETAIISKVGKFEDYLKLFQHLQTPKENLRVFEAVWAQIRVDFNKDNGKIKDFYEQLQDYISKSDLRAETDSRTKQAFAEFQTKVRTFIVNKESKLLANALAKVDIQVEDFLVAHCLKLLANYEYLMVKTIFTKAIDEVYNRKSTEILSRELLTIYQQDDRITFELMLDLQLHLFTRFKQLGGVNDIYLYEFAYNFSKIIKDAMFQMIEKQQSRRVEHVIESLPESLRHLFLRPTFCLYNKMYAFQFYLSMDVIWDAERRGAFVYTANTLNKLLPVWSTNITENESTNAVDLSFMFLNNNFQQYLYLDPNINNHTNILAGWQLSTVPWNSKWKVEFWNDVLIISQPELVVCADSTLYDTFRRFVFGIEAKLVNKRSREDCQWLARACA